MYFSNYGLRKTCLDKCLKTPISENPSTNDMVSGPKHSLNQNGSTFARFGDPCKDNLIGKSVS